MLLTWSTSVVLQPIITMASSKNSAKLTYERLERSFERLHDSVLTQFPELKDAARARNLQDAINEALYIARLGEGNVTVDSPGQVKRNLKIRIAEIHEEHDALDALATADTTAASEPGISAIAASSANSNTRDAPARKRTRRSTASEQLQENRLLATAAPSAQTPISRALSTVKKTHIPARSTTTKSTASIPKATPSIAPPPAPTAHTRRNNAHRRARSPRAPFADPAAEDAEQRAVALALLRLAEHGRPTASFPSSSGGGGGGGGGDSAYRGVQDLPLYTSPPAARTKRVRGVEGSEHHPDVGGAAKRSCVRPPLPCLAGLDAPRAFEAGVQYAVELMGGKGEGVVGWVQVELRRGSSGEGDGVVGGVGRGEGGGQGRGGGRGFWDVI